MIALKLAIRNLIGAGLRTWLNVGVLSFAFIVILFYRGWIDGWNAQARSDAIAWEHAQGRLQHADYDPLDPFTYTDAHGKLDPGDAPLDPVLVQQGTIYPEGRAMPVVLVGVDPGQRSLKLPTEALAAKDGQMSVMMGDGMARRMGVSEGDAMLLRWRDAHGTFDAAEVVLQKVFENDVPTVDFGKIYLPIERLRSMVGLPNEQTYFVVGEGYEQQAVQGWTYLDQDELLKQFDKIIESKQAGGLVMQWLLLAIALLAIFDTQVLSVFRRQKEIGTYISLGMTRRQVVGIFTVEGTMNAIGAILLAGVYGIPLLYWVARTGIPMPAAYEDVGLPIADRMYPVFGLSMVGMSTALVLISSIVVSYLPSRKIAKMNPVLALKGKIQ